MTINKNLEKIIHNTFIKYDIIWVIDKWFPDDEYQMEEAKLYTYISNNSPVNQEQILNELVDIIKEWFWETSLHNETLEVLKLMAWEIYSWLD